MFCIDGVSSLALSGAGDWAVIFNDKTMKWDVVDDSSGFSLEAWNLTRMGKCVRYVDFSSNGDFVIIS